MQHHDSLAHLVKMANQIADFFDAQTPGDLDGAARATAAHLKLFWAPRMRADLLAAYDAGGLEELGRVASEAVRSHRAAMLTPAAQVRGAAAQTFPQGGGDAG